MNKISKKLLNVVFLFSTTFICQYGIGSEKVIGGYWEGMDVDKSVIKYIQDNGYGGVMFWAVNQPALPPSTEVTGTNAQTLAGDAVTVFANNKPAKL